VKFTSELRDATCQWDHTVLSATRQRWPPRLHPNRAGWYSIYRPRKDERLSWPGWQVTYRKWFTRPQTVTHQSTNRVWRSATTLIEANALPLSQTANQRIPNYRVNVYSCTLTRFVTYALTKKYMSQMFKHIIVNAFQSSVTGLCELLPEMFKLLRLFLTIPVTTYTAERSFSHLRRMKTYLRSTIGQACLNHIAILSCYREETDNIYIHAIYTEFVSRNELRRKTTAVV